MKESEKSKVKRKLTLKQYVKRLENDISLLETVDLLRRFNKRERKYINTMFNKANKVIKKIKDMPLNRHMLYNKRENSIPIELDYLIQYGLITNDELIKYILKSDTK